jgi:hypothetical protein
LQTLVFAHRKELCQQLLGKLVRAGMPHQEIGVIKSGVPWRARGDEPDLERITDAQLWDGWARRKPGAKIQVCSIDTFRNKAPPQGIGLVVRDEAHRSLSASDMRIQEIYPEAKFLGLTATPFRADGKGLEKAFDEIVVAATYAELIELGFLVKPDCKSLPEADLTGVRTTAGDYNQKDLAFAVDKSEIVGDIVKHWQKYGNNAPTFCFAVNVEHSKHLRDRFLESGIAAAHVDGTTENEERDKAFADLAAGRIKVLTNCEVGIEGVDVPCVKTIILARPTQSERIFLQSAGRGSRPFEGKPFVLLDHAGCCLNVNFGGPPHWDREYSLEGRVKKKRGAMLPPAKKCPVCYAVVPIQTLVCPTPDCGHVFEIDEKDLKEKEGELKTIDEENEPHLKSLTEWRELKNKWTWENVELMARGKPLLPGAWCRKQWWNDHRDQQNPWPPRASKIPQWTKEQADYMKQFEVKPPEDLVAQLDAAVKAVTEKNETKAVKKAQAVEDRQYEKSKLKRERAVLRAMGEGRSQS